MSKRTVRFLSSAALLTVLAACGQPSTTSQPGNSTAASTSPSTSAAGGMDHSGHGGMAATTTSSAPFDAMFIDGMTPHHEGAVTMAQQALTQAERPEIKQLAQQIIDSQEREVQQMRQWRTQWYPNLPQTDGMHQDMGPMNVADDASKPFDQRFMEAMIPHHQSAVTMAQDAQQQAEHPELREFAGTVITDQQREITQMQQWLQQWYGG